LAEGRAMPLNSQDCGSREITPCIHRVSLLADGGVRVWRGDLIAAKNHRIFGFGRIFGTFVYFRPKFGSLLHNQLKIRIINAKFNFKKKSQMESC
jgi:hypothetical protein